MGPRTQRPWLVALLLLAVTLPIGAWVVRAFSVTTSITHFMPAGESRLLADVSRAVANSPLSRAVIVSLGGADTDTLVAASRGVEAALTNNPDFESVRAGVSDATQEAFFKLYFPRRRYFVSPQTQDSAATQLSAADLRQAARNLQRTLAQPTGAFTGKLAVDDPLQLFSELLARLESVRGDQVTTHEGQFVTRDGQHAILFVTTRASAFDNVAQRKVLGSIEQAIAAQRDKLHVALTSDITGIAKFSVRAQEQIEGDTQRIGFWSGLGVFVILVLVLGSVRYLVLGVVPIVLGLLAATAACLWAFGTIHGMTLAFGASTIGVCVDYPLHLFNHHALREPGRDAFSSFRSLRTALWLGAATTIAGFSGLAWTSMPGVRELALFSGVGVALAMVVSHLILPHFMPLSGAPTRAQTWLAQASWRVMQSAMARRKLLVALTLLALLISLVGATRISFNTHIDELAPAPADLVAIDERIRAQVGSHDPGRFVIALAPDMDTALQRNDEVYAALSQAVQAKEVATFYSLHTLLPSRASQQHNNTAWQQTHDLQPRVLDALEQEGFVSDAFARSTFFAPPILAPLTFEELQQSPLSAMVQGFVIKIDAQYAAVTYLKGVADSSALAARIDRLKGARYFDQRTLLNDVYDVYRTRVFELIAAGLLMVCALLFARYRRVRPVVASFMPAVLAASTALGLLALCGVPLDLMHVVGLVLVLSVGEDYGIFLVESMLHDEPMEATSLSVVLACLTTVLSFGLLALSVVPALRSLGQIVGLGTLLELLLAPIGVMWLRPGVEVRRQAQ